MLKYLNISIAINFENGNNWKRLGHREELHSCSTVMFHTVTLIDNEGLL